jgi:antitoxin component YwqK of YwqJK toxin-antitoxin module
MDKSITVLIRHPDPTKQCNYFQGEIIARLRLYYSTPKKDRISAIIKFLSKYKDLDTNATSTNMTLNSVIAGMSGIVHTYYENHKDSIVEYANENKLDGDAMDYDETNIHIRHLAQYFAWTGQRAPRAEKRAAILEFLTKYKDLHTNETTTTITLNAVIANMSGIVRSYYEEEKASIVIYANENKSVGDMTDYNENNIYIRHLDMYYSTSAKRARAEKRAAILEFLSRYKDLDTNATSTTITLNSVIDDMSAIVRTYYEEEKASIVIYANVSSRWGI